ncbi:helix-turn-helix transcriptional regulator [Sediminimonas qiaohouensis]|nr:helix-turn-helix domain-containing protein [Sediminimonas qiaohouensis]
MYHTLLTVTQVATMFSAGNSTIWRWAKAGTIPKPIKVGGATRWLREEVIAHIEKLHDGTPNPTEGDS